MSDEYVVILKIENEEPLIVGKQRKSGAFNISADYIPGSTLVGAIINEIASNSPQNAQIRGLMEQINSTPAVPLPSYNPPDDFSRFPLYYSVNVLKKRTGNEDYIFAFKGKPGYKKKRGMYFIDGNEIRIIKVEKARYTHVKIDDRFASVDGSPDSNSLYQVLAIPEKSRFYAKARIPKEIRDMLKKGIEVFIGSMRLRGYGAARVSISKEIEKDTYLQRRLAKVKPGEMVIVALSPVLVNSNAVIQLRNDINVGEDLINTVANYYFSQQFSPSPFSLSLASGMPSCTFVAYTTNMNGQPIQPKFLRLPICHGLAAKVNSATNVPQNIIECLEIPAPIRVNNRIVWGMNWFELNYPVPR
ncbi:MAG: hypothetical protein QXL15_04365 [Candidatus Korarchaeota archaeon]